MESITGHEIVRLLSVTSEYKGSLILLKKKIHYFSGESESSGVDLEVRLG